MQPFYNDFMGAPMMNPGMFVQAGGPPPQIMPPANYPGAPMMMNPMGMSPQGPPLDYNAPMGSSGGMSMNPMGSNMGNMMAPPMGMGQGPPPLNFNAPMGGNSGGVPNNNMMMGNMNPYQNIPIQPGFQMQASMPPQPSPYNSMNSNIPVAAASHGPLPQFGPFAQPMGQQQSLANNVNLGVHTNSNGPPQATPSQGGRRKALVIGINYPTDPVAKLPGCNNDAAFVRYLLATKFNFPLDSIFLMTDDMMDARRPTRDNIINAMRWLVAGAAAGDSLYFHYSGHGSQTRDLDGDEDDGMDETILPVDFRTAGMIVDDDIHRLLCAPLPLGAKLTATMDCCHSGTAMDLPYLFSNGQWLYSNKGIRKATQGDVILYSSCRDDQLCADSSSLARVASTGVLTYAFCRAVEASPPGASYGSLFQMMSSFARQKGFAQIIQLSSGRPIDLNSPLQI